MDDDELIGARASGDGDDTALRELFSRHAPWLAARLRKTLSPDDVEDVLQETFIAVWQHAKTYQARGTPHAWLWVIARNQAAMLLRKRGQPPRVHDPRRPHPPRGRQLRMPATTGLPRPTSPRPTSPRPASPSRQADGLSCNKSFLIYRNRQLAITFRP